ncbi:MAG TPA: hypothetical protein VNA65_02665 [Candidatus Dormibacteraeota bacterium]|nr:hypothetical protein [Candidatus Dormibacteraeota bacterium]
MLAYLFFHQPAVSVDRGEYEEGLRRFHAALAEGNVEGFISSSTYRVGGRYCDWYLVQNSAALDVLNDAAVSGPRLHVHDAVAHQAIDGAGKLLKLIAGNHDASAGFEVRFSKPRGASYGQLYSLLKPWTDREDVSLWRRMMVLGPPPEFVLLSRSREELPGDMEPEILIRETI